MVTRNLSFSIFFFIFTLGAVAQDNAKYQEVDDFVKSFPFKPYTLPDLKVLQREIKRKFQSEDELARAAYVWITNNIAYDCEGYRRHEGIYDLNMVIAKRKGVCAGYASLFKNFCDEFGIECEVVLGFANGLDVGQLDPGNLKSNHAWNAVKIDGAWRLVDATWGSGYASDSCRAYIPKLDEKYFYARPVELIKTHFPDDSSRQFLLKPFTAKQFVDSIVSRQTADSLSEVADSIAALRFEHPDSVIRKKMGEVVRFFFKTKANLNSIMVSTYGRTPITIVDSVQRYDSGYYYDFKIIEEGGYRVEFSLFYDTHREGETFTGTEVEAYWLQVQRPSRKSSVGAVKKTAGR